ncbi:MAG: hypothetical protein FJX76_03015 [Armatimonadetes bacterium]|nr:hypothetical protein [Armatimonadota bacterium]
MRFFFLLGILLFCAGPARAAEPRESGRLLRVDVTKRMVVFVRADGRRLNPYIQPESKMRRGGLDCTLSDFRPGDQISVRIAGGFNDNPLVCDALMDVASAAASLSGTPHFAPGCLDPFYTTGGPAAPTPYIVPPSAIIAEGGSENVSNMCDQSAPAQPPSAPPPSTLVPLSNQVQLQGTIVGITTATRTLRVKSALGPSYFSVVVPPRGDVEVAHTGTPIGFEQLQTGGNITVTGTYMPSGSLLSSKLVLNPYNQ